LRVTKGAGARGHLMSPAMIAAAAAAIVDRLADLLHLELRN
jgi:homoaconitase/3-isopropylmalate dehydratase large subunit